MVPPEMGHMGTRIGSYRVIVHTQAGSLPIKIKLTTCSYLAACMLRLDYSATRHPYP
jgi:hypothetical protein